MTNANKKTSDQPAPSYRLISGFADRNLGSTITKGFIHGKPCPLETSETGLAWLLPYLPAHFQIITKTRLYNFDPLKPHFYTVKLGFTGVYIIFLISAQKHTLWVFDRTASF